MDFTFHPEGFLTALPYLAQGLVGTFLVIGIIIGVTLLLNAVTGGKPKDDTNGDENA